MQLIAECGVNWNTLEEAKEMIRQSKSAGVEYCKFQLYSWPEIKEDPDIIREHEQKIMLTSDTAKELFDYGKQINQKVFFTPMYLEAVDICEKIGVDLYKIRFADRYNIPLIRKILDTHKRIIMSIDHQYKPPGLVLNDPHRIDFLLCVSKYPASLEDYKLDKSTFRGFSGISDHTPNIELARKALNVNHDIIIEKHVKLNDNCIEKDWSTAFGELRSLQEEEEKKMSLKEEIEKIEEEEESEEYNRRLAEIEKRIYGLYHRIAVIVEYIDKQKEVTTTEEQEIEALIAKRIKLASLQLDLDIKNITKRLKEQKNEKEETTESKEAEKQKKKVLGLGKEVGDV